MKQQRLIGAHVSAQGGFQNSPERAHAIGCNYLQIFSENPRVWQRQTASEEKVSSFLENQKKFDILGNAIHALYLVNLASDDPELVAKAHKSLVGDLQLASRIHSTGVVVHVGSYKTRSFAETREHILENIAAILQETPDDSVFLIENSAGQRGKVGSDLREIQWLLQNLQAGSRVGVCIDTCHAFAAGYSLIPVQGERYLFGTIEELGIGDAIRLIHLNDSRDEYCSHRDRHANLHEGMIDPAMLAAAANHPLFASIPLVLEVPGRESNGPDSENVDRLKAMLE